MIETEQPSTLIKPYYQDDYVTLYHGESLRILATLQDESIDAVITDPPYSSGGMTRSDRTADPSTKYVQTATMKTRPSFSGDNRDGRSWDYWASLWINECLGIVKEGGYCLIFTDWRMLPTTTDAIQSGGFVWRGIVSWDKGLGSRAPHTGYFRHQCEYVVWGTKGTSEPASHAGPFPGAFQFNVKQSDKFHMTGKPTPLMRELVRVVPPNGRVLDPFAGSGTTLVAAKLEGRKAIGIEQSEEYCETAANRLSQGVLF